MATIVYCPTGGALNGADLSGDDIAAQTYSEFERYAGTSWSRTRSRTVRPVPVYPVPPPPPPIQVGNVDLLVTAECEDPEVGNSISVNVPAGSFWAIGQAAADAAAWAYWYPLCVAQLNCSPAEVQAVSGASQYAALGFEEFGSGGTWFSEPILEPDVYQVNL